MKILFLHGWMSVPGGVKPTFLAQHGHEVINPKLPDDDINLAVKIAQAEFDKHRLPPYDASTTKGLTTMAKPREPWNIRPAKKPASVTASLKTEVETKARDLIENVLKPKYVQPAKEGEQSNYIIDIGAKWYRGYFYFFTTYACPGPNALSPTFEWRFARMEPLRAGKFALYAMRYTGKEWVGVLDALSVDECMKAIQDDDWFQL